MGLNGNNNEEPRMPITCPKCNQRFSALIPHLEIVNAPRVSVITAAHEKPVTCICGQQFIIGMTEAQVGWAVQPIQTEKPRIVVPKLSLAK